MWQWLNVGLINDLMLSKSIFSHHFLVFAQDSVHIASNIYPSESELIFAQSVVNAQHYLSILSSLSSLCRSFCQVYFENSQPINSGTVIKRSTLLTLLISIFLLIRNQPAASLMNPVEVYFLQGPSLWNKLNISVRESNKFKTHLFSAAYNIPKSYIGSFISPKWKRWLR